MKKILYIFCVACLFASCHTVLQVPTVERSTPQVEKPSVEFVGFKNLSRNHIMFKEFGSALERANIAVNKQSYYMGTFSLMELENYKSSMRYISFIDVVRHTYSHNDAINDNIDMYNAGLIIACVTTGLLFPVYVPLFCAWDKNDCEMALIGEYNLIIYDTEKKQIVLSSPFEIHYQEQFKGQYSYKKTDTKQIDEQFKNMLYNEFFEQYLHAHQYLRDLEQ